MSAADRIRRVSIQHRGGETVKITLKKKVIVAVAVHL